MVNKAGDDAILIPDHRHLGMAAAHLGQQKPGALVLRDKVRRAQHVASASAFGPSPVK